MFHSRIRIGLAVGLVAAGLAIGAPVARAQETVRVALGDVVSEETLAFIVALERAKERGVDYELTSFAEEELAIQAIVGGQSDLGIGTPYAVIQKAKVPLRAIFQMSSLVFFPVVSTGVRELEGPRRPALRFQFPRLGDRGLWRRDGGARRDHVQRAHLCVGLRQPRDRAHERHHQGDDPRPLQQEQGHGGGGDKFHVLPGVNEKVSDEILFANAEWLAANQETATILVEELMKLWREMNQNPGIIEEERVKRNLLADQPAEVIEEVPDYYEEGVESGIWNPEGATEALAKADFTFYVDAGQLEGPAENLKVEDYWDLSIIEAAKKNIGG